MSENRVQAINAALILALSGFGDAFLYVALPSNSTLVAAPIVWIGVLLSINRFVRLFANPLFAFLFHRFGFRRIAIIAAILSALTTLTYGIATDLALWIFARVIWGFCFSALRITAISYSLRGENQGFVAGVSKSLQEIGPAIALLIGPLLLQWFDFRMTFVIFALMSFPAILISLRLRDLPSESSHFVFGVRLIPSMFSILTFSSAFFVQGALVVVLVTLLKQSKEIGLAPIDTLAIAGALLAYRRLSLIFFSPLGGWAGDKWGIYKTYAAAQILTILGLFLIAQQFSVIGSIITFTFNSVVLTLSPNLAVANGEIPLKAVAANSTWNDFGAAVGVLFAGSLLPSLELNSIFLAGGLVLTGTLLFYAKGVGLRFNRVLQWK